MKKSLITLALFFTVLISEAQKAFEGVWATEGSTYETVVIASDYAVLKIINYSFEEENTLNEVILSQTKTTITTTIYNPKNGYRIKLKYRIIDENTLECVFTGDHNETLIMTKKQYGI